MICPNCQQDVTGKYCSFCGALLEPEDTGEDLPWREQPQDTAPDHPRPLGSLSGRPDTASESRPAASAPRARNAGAKKATVSKRDTRSRKSTQTVKQTVRRKTKVRKKRKGNHLLASAMTGSVKNLWKTSVLCVQWICFGLMILLTFRLFQGFWTNRLVLGSLSGVWKERNLAQAVYLCLALCILIFGVLQSLWMISRKKLPDNGKLRRIDMGRGLFGFLIFLLLALAARYLNSWIPGSPQLLMGLKLTLSAVSGLGTSFLFLSAAGLALCIFRRVGTR